MTTCHYCGSPAKVNGNNWNGESYERIDLCLVCRESVGFAKAPRRPRQPRQPRPLYGDYAQLAAFCGISTDGSGRVIR